MIPDRTEASLGSKSSLDYAVSEILKLMTFYFQRRLFLSAMSMPEEFPLSALGNVSTLNQQLPTLIVIYFSQHVWA
jgi:hypothetical protein